MNMAIAEDWSSLTPNKHNRYTRLIFPGTSEHDRYTGLIFPGTQLTRPLHRTDIPQHPMNTAVTKDWSSPAPIEQNCYRGLSSKSTSRHSQHQETNLGEHTNIPSIHQARACLILSINSWHCMSNQTISLSLVLSQCHHRCVHRHCSWTLPGLPSQPPPVGRCIYTDTLPVFPTWGHHYRGQKIPPGKTGQNAFIQSYKSNPTSDTDSTNITGPN